MRNDNTRERLKVDSITERCRKAGMIWPHKEARPRIRRKKDSGDGPTYHLGEESEEDMRAI